jgi:hypothetical protein
MAQYGRCSSPVQRFATGDFTARRAGEIGASSLTLQTKAQRLVEVANSSEQTQKGKAMIKNIDLDLVCELSTEEVNERPQQMSAAMTEYDQVESDKKDAVKEYTEQMKELRGRMRRLSRTITSKTESRIVKCCTYFHTPVVGTKRTVRLDTGELVREEPMTNAECQDNLFNEREEWEKIMGTQRPENSASTEEQSEDDSQSNG